MRQLARLSMLGSILVALGPGCGPQPAATTPGTPPGPPPGSTVQCGDGPRQTLDCSTGFSYDARKVEGSLKVLNVGASGSTEKTAVRRINEQVEQYANAHARLCRDYNACSVSAADYSRRTEELEEALIPLSANANAFAAAASYADRQQVLSNIYTQVVPQEARVEEITFRMGIEAELPASVGGGLIRLQPGGKLPTNARVAFTFEVSRDAFLYIFQTSPSGEPTVLFPHPEMTGASNPLPGSTPRRIPPGAQRFRVNEKDLGVERVYVIASIEPLASLDAAVGKIAAGSVTNIQQDQSLAALGKLASPANDCAPPATTRALELEAGCTRGLELMEAPPAGQGPATLVARTDPGDGIIVKAFSFHHVTEEQFGGSGASAPAPAAPPGPSRPKAPRKRGMEDEEELISQ